MPAPSVEEVWRTLTANPDLLPATFKTLAKTLEVDEEKVPGLFLDFATEHPRTCVSFRYPPLPCGAIVHLDPLPEKT